MSTPPNASLTCSIAHNTRARSVTSHSSASALPPAWLILCASSSSCARRRASSATCAPCSPNASATPWPIPLDAPVTTTDLSKKYPRTGPLDFRLAWLIIVTSIWAPWHGTDCRGVAFLALCAGPRAGANPRQGGLPRRYAVINLSSSVRRGNTEGSERRELSLLKSPLPAH